MYKVAFLFLGYSHFYIPYFEVAFPLVFLLFGGILPLVERKFLAQVQNRVGPEIIGVGGRFQFVADAIKVLSKHTKETHSTEESSYSFYYNVYISLGLTLFCFTPWMDGVLLHDVYLLIPTYLIFFTLSNLCLVVVGVTSGNKYTALASSRCVNMMFLAELILAIFFSFLFFISSSLDLELSDLSTGYRTLPSTLVIVMPLCVQSVLAETGRAPYDLVESESEMVMGYSSEYVGFYFAGFILVEYLYMFLIISIPTLLINV